jgi:serine/threonine protein kinase
LPFEKIDFGKVSLNDFEFDNKPLGSGSFGQVLKTKFKLDNKIYAVKVMNKEFLKKVNPFKYNPMSIEEKGEVAVPREEDND